MLTGSRKSKTIDTQRASLAVGRPGIDPRIWASEAIVTAVRTSASGFFVDVLLLPDQIPETARVGTMYAGPGYGFHFPMDVDDSVLVIAPHGSMDQGLVAMPRWWSTGEPPPAVAQAKPTDVLLEIKPGAAVRVRTAGAGDIVLHPQGTGRVLLGDEDGATHPVLRGDVFQARFNAHTHLDSTGAQTGGPISGAIPNPFFNPLNPPNLLTNPLMIGTPSQSGSGDLSPNVRVK